MGKSQRPQVVTITLPNGESFDVCRSETELLLDFPQIVAEGFLFTSKCDKIYNCFAWAAHDKQQWWEPDESYYYYWPEGADREYTLDAVIQAYQTIGYKESKTGGILVAGIEKIAIYADRIGPSHAARQLEDGAWTSKNGPYEDLRHNTTTALASRLYGEVVLYMERDRLS